MNYIAEKGCNLQLLLITFNYFCHKFCCIDLFISGYQQYFSMLVLKGIGDYGLIFFICTMQALTLN